MKLSIEDDKLPMEIDKVIHEPARLKIVAQLYVVDSADMVFLMRQTELTWGNLSSHVSKLETAGYVDITKEFFENKPRTTLKLTEEGRKAFETYRENIKRMIDV
ncbi:MAG: transcriptional regulator [Candidatus Thorarchaeota archaeon]|nr:transcriptional regulator [Candidatus Thorarchaeota archaeon]